MPASWLATCQKYNKAVQNLVPVLASWQGKALFNQCRQRRNQITTGIEWLTGQRVHRERSTEKAHRNARLVNFEYRKATSICM